MKLQYSSLVSIYVIALLVSIAGTKISSTAFTICNHRRHHDRTLLLQPKIFFNPPSRTINPWNIPREQQDSNHITVLHATNRLKKRNNNVSGFGGTAIQPCPCGSTQSYVKCCGRLHHDLPSYVNATAEQVVRARYSAYALREIDFIISSTHPLNKDFMIDIEHWKTQIRNNCYDNFKLTKCKILDEKYEGEIAIVKFIATMIQVDLKEKTSFMETSTFEKLTQGKMMGAWLYKSGIVESVPSEI